MNWVPTSIAINQSNYKHQINYKEELLKSMKIVESITGVKVYGHRACQASVMKTT